MEDLKQYYAHQTKVGRGALKDKKFMDHLKANSINELKELYPKLRCIASSNFELVVFEEHEDNIVNNLATVRVEIRA